MGWRNRIFAVLSLAFLVSVCRVMFSLREDSIHHGHTEKNVSPPRQDRKTRILPSTEKDWFKDCAISNTTNITNERSSSCLRKLDFSDTLECNTACQESVQRYRKMNTRRACTNVLERSSFSIWNKEGNLTRKTLKRLHHLIPIDNSDIIFCYIPKDGCTAWKRILLTVTGHISSPSFPTEDIHGLFKRKLKSLASFTLEGAERRLKTYKKFLFVREPLERLLSLFLDKAVKEGILPYNEADFEPFLKFIIKERHSAVPSHYSEHWMQASQLCLPCDISYDFIGRLETSIRDTQYIFHHFIRQNRDRLTMYREPNHPTNSSSSEKKKKYFQQVSGDILRKAIDKYHRDYVLFTYDKPSV